METLRAYAVAGGVLTGLTSTEAGARSSAVKVASSSAFGLRATFTSGDETVAVGPIGAVAGSAPPAHKKTAKVAVLNQFSPIVEGSLPIPAFFIAATGITSHAALNKEKVTGDIPCHPVCTFVPAGVRVLAINIRLTNATIRGRTVSGNIVVGESAAQ